MSTLNSGDMNIERSSTRIRAPPGGQSSVFIGDSAPEAHNTTRANARPTSLAGFYVGDQNDSATNSSSQQTSKRRAYQQPPGNDIFGNDGGGGGGLDSSPRRGGPQPKQTLDVFNNDSAPSASHQGGGRCPLSCPEQLDIFGREAVPAQTPGRRPIQQPNSNIFENNDQNIPMDYRSHAASSQQELQLHVEDYRNAEYVPAGSRNRQQGNSSSGIFDTNPSNSHSEVAQTRRRAPPSAHASADVFGFHPDQYREAINYETSSHQQYGHQQGRQGAGGDTTQSLASALGGGGGGGWQQQSPSRSQSRPNTGNSSQVGMLMGNQQAQSGGVGQAGGRKKSNAGQSSLVLN